MLYVGNSRGELYVVEGGRARGLDLAAEVPWADDGIHYGSAVLRGGRLYKPDGSLFGEFNLVLIPYGLVGGVYEAPRYAVVVLGDEAKVIDLDSWRPAHEVRCLGKWDFSPIYPFADVKSLYCTDGFVVVATPEEYRLIPAPCGVSFHVDMLDPRLLIVRDIEMGEESVSTVFKALTIDGRYLTTYTVEGSDGAEPLSVANALVYYLPGAVVWRDRKITVSDFFISTYGVVVGRQVVGDVKLELPCEPEYILLDKYICNGEVARIEV
jgi:hypothetical protein